MELKQLSFFKRTAELEHMSRAAEELLVSQPYLSKTISDLEGELGAPLFDHKGRNIVLNYCGKAFYAHVVNIFNELEDAKKEVQNISLSQQSTIRVATNIGQFMPSLLGIVTSGEEGISIHQRSAPWRDIIHMLRNAEVDFVLCSPPLEEDVEFETLPLRYERAAVIYPEGHWLEGCAEIDMSALGEETFISVAKGYGAREPFDAAFAVCGVPAKMVIETTDTTSVFEYVKRGLGIAAVPLTTVLRDPCFQKRYTLLTHNIGGEIALSWRRRQFMGAAGRRFIQCTTTYFDSLETENAELIRALAADGENDV